MVTIKCRGITFSNIQAVIFDKDGTLEDSQEFLRLLGIKRSRLADAQIPGVGEPLQMAFGIVEGGSIDPTGLLAVGSRRENEIVAAGYIAETGRGWLESLTMARRAFDEADEMFKNSAVSPLFVGSLEVLKYLSEAGLKLGILSAATTESVHKFVKHHALAEWIQLEMGVDSTLHKPDPKLFLQACEKLGVNPAATLMVGDSAGDIQMGKNAGAAGCIGICWGKAEVRHLENADVAIASLEEITILAD